jgi:hypothetical protein
MNCKAFFIRWPQPAGLSSLSVKPTGTLALAFRVPFLPQAPQAQEEASANAPVAGAA